MKLLYELIQDSSISVPILSQKLGINASVLYSRIKRLTKKKLIKKFTVDIHKKFMETREIISISEVTGRFDIIIDVYAKNLEALHSVVIEKIGKIEGIQNTETFVELQKTDKNPNYLIE